jgi:hypothetical protein
MACAGHAVSHMEQDAMSCRADRLRSVSCAGVVLIALGFSALAADDERPHPEKTVRAVRGMTPPKLDGIFDDEVWREAPLGDDFWHLDAENRDPAPATEQTEFQIAYDDEALYVAVMCYDSEPDKIVSRLTRREEEAERDWILVRLDPHHDHKGGAYFIVGPSGWQKDGVLFDNSWGSDTWNGVWEVETRLSDQGWSAEYRIPYHVLRFAERAEYTWGVTVHRNISRKQEETQWILAREGDGGIASRFGHLSGIEGISPPTHLEVLPFTLGRSSFAARDETGSRSTDLFGSTGLDVRYGLSSNISLNATLNPDFGQVEADPAVVNLSVFETFFREQRPFFVEGSSVFNMPGVYLYGVNGYSSLFHSRRIGRRPGRFAIPDGAAELSRPDASTILAAAKLSGKTESGMSFAVLETLTAAEYALIEETTADPVTGQTQRVERDHLVEPMTNHFVARTVQDVGALSKLGATMTAMNGEGFAPAYVGSVDAARRFSEGGARLFGRLAGSRSGAFDARKRGYEGALLLEDWSGTWGGQAYVDVRSREFDTNDLGFTRRSDIVQSGAWGSLVPQHPFFIFRSSMWMADVHANWNLDGDRLSRGFGGWGFNQLKNYWETGWGIHHDLERLDDLATRGGPQMLVLPSWNWNANVGTDGRRPVKFSIKGGTGWSERRVSTNGSVGIGVDIKPASNVQISVNPSYSTSHDDAQWVENIDADNDGEHDRFVFGELDQDVFDLGVRANLSLTTKLSLQTYLQSFVVKGDYTAFKELAAPQTYSFTGVDQSELSGNPDFNNRSLRGNMVLRWEYEPGSTLFLVWSQNRRGSLGLDDAEFRPLPSVRDSFTDDGEDVFLIKLNYWIGM